MPINSNNFNSQIETLNDKNPLKFVQNNKRSFKENLNDLKINSTHSSRSKNYNYVNIFKVIVIKLITYLNICNSNL